MTRTSEWHILAAIGLAALAALLALACGGGEASSTSAFTEIQRVAGVKAGQPVLVFVYTDG